METEKCLLVLRSKLPDSRDFPQKKKKKGTGKSSYQKNSEVYPLPGTVTRPKQEHTQQLSHLGKDEQ